MRRLRIAVSLIQATTLLGGLQPWEAEGRQHVALEVTRDIHLVGPWEFVGGVAGASHEGVLGAGTLAGVRLNLGRFDGAFLGGTWWYEEAVPVPGSQRFVFSAQLEVGVQAGAWRVAGALHHISNAGFGEVNPGFNGFGVSVGWSR